MSYRGDKMDNPSRGLNPAATPPPLHHQINQLVLTLPAGKSGFCYVTLGDSGKERQWRGLTYHFRLKQ
jgi:hypothetical protein